MREIRDNYGPGSFHVHKFQWLAWKHPETWRAVQQLSRIVRGQEPTYPFKPIQPGPFGESRADYPLWLIDYGGAVLSD
jgi:uncharacterized lipoprotein YddW (UPF0748 family)